MAAFLTRDAIQAAKAALTQIVAVPEWSGQLRVRALSGAEVESIFEWSRVTEGRGRKQKTRIRVQGTRAKIVALGAVTEDGSPMFTEADEPWLNAANAQALTRVAEAIQRLSGMLDDEEDETDEGTLGEGSAATSGAASPSV